jgi:hypothetical protein
MQFLFHGLVCIEHYWQKTSHRLIKTYPFILLLILLLLAPNATPIARAHGGIVEVVRINTGGPAQLVDGVEWLGCASQSNCFNFVSGGFSYTKMPLMGVDPVASPANQFIYQSEWTGGATTNIPAGSVAFAFHVPVPNGDHLIRLHFAEQVQNGVGLRLFDVKIEGTTVLSNFDIYGLSH